MTITDIRRIARADATAIAEVEDARFLDLLRSLTDDEWRMPTACDVWDVHAMVGHVLGAAESASMRELLHQFRVGKFFSKGIDGVNDVQVRERAGLSAAEVLDRLAAAQPRFRASRKRLPAPMRAVKLPTDAEHGKITMGHLMDVVYTRDVWMHRLDICRTTGRTFELTPDHDGRIVADAVGDWAARHGRPFELVLTGTAGGTFVVGEGGEHLELDAVEFALIQSGRAEGAGLLATKVLF